MTPLYLHRLVLDDRFEVTGVSYQTSISGEISHVERKQYGGGSNSTPIARFFATRPGYIEGVKEHWRIDCFVKFHPLAGKPEELTRALCLALVENGHCSEPYWMSWHHSAEIGGAKQGELWSDD